MHKKPREWRKLVKKLQRKRRRQKLAKERYEKEIEEEKRLLNDEKHQLWLKEMEELENMQIERERLRQEAEEEAWLRRELIAQQQFRREQKRLAAEAAKHEAERLEKIQKQQQLEAEKRKKHEEKLAAFEQTINILDQYLEKPNMLTPAALNVCTETRPSQSICEFFQRTNCCKYGYSCIYNHCRPLLSRILLFSHFFQHPLLQLTSENEYDGGDSQLELNESDLYQAYSEFFEDVIIELEKFGKIINFRAVRNTATHFRGHVFVEYQTKRSALKAFINLQGRFYAGKHINVEFSQLKSWRSAVCGASLVGKCLKGYQCNYLHIFKNPGNKYNMPLENKTETIATLTTPLLSWDDIGKRSNEQQERNWRWSESPEVERIIEPTKSKISEKEKSYARKHKKHRKGKESSRKKHKRKKSAKHKSEKFEKT